MKDVMVILLSWFFGLSVSYVYSGTFVARWEASVDDNVWVSTIDTSLAGFNSTPSYFTSLRTDSVVLARHLHGHLTILFPTKDSFMISLVPVMDNYTVGDIGDIPEGDLVLRWIGVTTESEYFDYGMSRDVEDYYFQDGFLFNVSTGAGKFDESLTLSQISGDDLLMNRFTGPAAIYNKGWKSSPVNNEEFYKFIQRMPIIENYTVSDVIDRNLHLQWININDNCNFDWAYDHSGSTLYIPSNDDYQIIVSNAPQDVLISLYDGVGTWEFYDTVIVPLDVGFKVYIKSRQGIIQGDPSTWHIRWVSLENCPANGICYLCAPCQCDNGNCTGDVCECDDGWEGKTCSDNINECITGNYTCSETEDCEDTMGSYNCICKEGWGGQNCTDITDCAVLPCTENGDCIIVDGSFECGCHPGWKGNTCSEDVDECDDESICFERSFCHNINGSYECRCEEGYLFNNGNCEEPVEDCWTSNVKCSCVNETLTCLAVESYQTCVGYTAKPECSSDEISLDGVIVIGGSNSSTFDLSDLRLNINGDLTLTETLTLKKQYQNTILVSGCVNLSGTLEVDVSGVKDQDKGVIVKSSMNCINGDFNDIIIRNASECEQVDFEKQKFVGNYTILFKVTNTCQTNTWLYITIIGIILFFVVLILLVLFVPSLRERVFPHRRKILDEHKNEIINNKVTELDNELLSLAHRTQDLQTELNQLDHK